MGLVLAPNFAHQRPAALLPLEGAGAAPARAGRHGRVGLRQQPLRLLLAVPERWEFAAAQFRHALALLNLFQHFVLFGFALVAGAARFVGLLQFRRLARFKTVH